MALRSAVWYPLYVGAHCGCLGYMAACELSIRAQSSACTDGAPSSASVPDVLRSKGKVRTLRSLVLHPTAFNTVLFGGPVLCAFTIAIPMLLGDRVFNDALPRHRLWLAQAAQPSVNVAELAAEARSIWLQVTRAYWYDSITYVGEHDQLGGHSGQKADNPLLTQCGSFGCVSSNAADCLPLLIIHHLLVDWLSVSHAHHHRCTHHATHQVSSQA